jgi:hypothetical protein
MSPVLPLELLRAIVRHVDNTESLLALLVTNHALHEEVERVLYHTFNTHRRRSEDQQWVDIPESNLLQFLDRVVASDQVASYVQRVNMEQLLWYGSEEFWDSFEKALPRMCNLETLGTYCSVMIRRCNLQAYNDALQLTFRPTRTDSLSF